MLRETFDRVQREREPQLLTLIGVPETGKTRLVSELARELDRVRGTVRLVAGLGRSARQAFEAMTRIAENFGSPPSSGSPGPTRPSSPCSKGGSTMRTA